MKKIKIDQMVFNGPVKINYVILHYQVISDTIECVESILKLNNDKIYQKIIIVDNASPNGTGKILKKKYRNTLNIEVVLSELNLGFAKGNNLGCKYATDKFNPDYLVVLNNDIVIEQFNFQQIIVQLDENHHFDILGPDIISLVDGVHQSPVNYAITTKSKICKEFLFLTILFILSLVHLDQKFLTFWNKKKEIDIINNRNLSKIIKDEKIHGAALIFSKFYFNRFRNVFFEKTFMYMEEDILLRRVMRNNLKMIFSTDLSLYHKEDSATDAVFKKSIKKRRFIYKETIKSLKEFYKAFDKL